MPNSFASRYRQVLRQLFGRVFKSADGYRADELRRIERTSEYRLPGALRDFYRAVGRFEPIMSSHNRFYEPGRLDRMDGRQVFCEENQQVVYWGFREEDQDRPDPPVFVGLTCDPMEWRPEADRCSDFVTGMIYCHALGVLPHRRSGSAPVTIRKAAAAWPLVWLDAHTRLYSQGAVVLSLTTRDRRTVDVSAAALQEHLLNDLAAVLGIRWHGR